MELRKAQNALLLIWSIGVIPLVAWLFLTITTDCESCFWKPLSYATPPLSMMVLVFFNRDENSRTIAKDHYWATVILSIIFLLTIAVAILSSVLSSDPIESKMSIMDQFERYDELLTLISGFTMAGLGVVFSKKSEPIEKVN